MIKLEVFSSVNNAALIIKGDNISKLDLVLCFREFQNKLHVYEVQDRLLNLCCLLLFHLLSELKRFFLVSLFKSI